MSETVNCHRFAGVVLESQDPNCWLTFFDTCDSVGRRGDHEGKHCS